MNRHLFKLKPDISRRLQVFAVALAALALLLAACSSGSSQAEPTSTQLTQVPEYTGIIAASEFVVGENRFPFGLVSDDGSLLENAQVNVRYYLLGPETDEFRSEVPAQFHIIEGITPHLHGDDQIHEHLESRGAYVVAKAIFDTAGFWGAEFDATTADGKRISISQRAFEVKETSSVPFVGDRVPPSQNLTLSDVDSIEDIETRVPPDDMHELSVVQALQIGKPFVVVFATPMFCVTRMCGPVTDIVAELHDRYREEVNFIHIEPWDLKAARGEGRLVPIDVALQWKLPTEPWVFVVDRNGMVASRFEGLVASVEVQDAIIAVLQ